MTTLRGNPNFEMAPEGVVELLSLAPDSLIVEPMYRESPRVCCYKLTCVYQADRGYVEASAWIDWEHPIERWHQAISGLLGHVPDTQIRGR